DLSGVRSTYQPVTTLTSQGPEPVKCPGLLRQHDMSRPLRSTRLAIRIIPWPSAAVTVGGQPAGVFPSTVGPDTEGAVPQARGGGARRWGGACRTGGRAVAGQTAPA